MTDKKQDQRYNKNEADQELVKEEIKLAQQLKLAYCNGSGEEKDPKKAAEIFHKIGLNYRKRSPDKISLIKSAGLFNAAIVRKPKTIVQIRDDLSEVCQHVLQQANAEYPQAHLIKKADDVKISIEKLREEVTMLLEYTLPNIPVNKTDKSFRKLNSAKISAIQFINKQIAHKYKEIMADVSLFCQKVMGKPPCEFAVVGMGSLAREEITPYSDFEHIILLYDDKNYKDHVEYFKWFSVIFHIVILNVGETIIPSLNVKSLNGKESEEGDWYYDAITKRGISFDGMMPHACKFPLGTQYNELIKSVSEMLKYLGSKATLKEGYHLADILTKTCFVFGNINIFKQFEKGAQTYRNNTSQTNIINEVQQQVKDDLKSFSTRFCLTNLKSETKINIKKFVYRSTTIFISALARICNISANSCFDIICEMKKRKKITQNTAEKLNCAIAIACEMRLKVYIKNKSQCDNAFTLEQEGIKSFLNIVGVASTVNYFQIAYCLQCEVAKQLQFTKLHFYSDPQLINTTIGLAFKLKDLTKICINPQKRYWHSKDFDFDKCINQLETEPKVNYSTNPADISRGSNDTDASIQTDFNKEQIKNIANYLRSSEIYDEALDFYKQLLNIQQHESKNLCLNKDVAWAKNQIGFCLMHLQQPGKALEYLNQALEIEINSSCNANLDNNIGLTFHYIGLCQSHMQKHKEGLTNMLKALEIFKNTSRDEDQDRNIAMTLLVIGRCYTHLKQHKESLKFLKRALEIQRKITLEKNEDLDIASTLNEIGNCHRSLQEYEVASLYYTWAIQIFQNATVDAKLDRNIAALFENVADCHLNLQKHLEALTFFDKALKIHYATTLETEKDSSIASICNKIGFIHSSFDQYDNALQYLSQSLKIFRNITSNADKDRVLAGTLNNIGCSYLSLDQYSEAKKHLDEALKIYKNTSLNTDEDRELALTQSSVGKCFTKLQKYNESWKCLEESLKIFENTTSDEQKDGYIADTYNYMGECLIGKQQNQLALPHLQRALNIYENVNFTEEEKDKRLAKNFYNLGVCLMELQDHTKSQKYLKKSLKMYKMIPLNDYTATKISILRLLIN